MERADFMSGASMSTSPTPGVAYRQTPSRRTHMYQTDLGHRQEPSWPANVEKPAADARSRRHRERRGLAGVLVARPRRADSLDDLLFENGDTFGGGGCGPLSRAATHPNVPWANFTETTLGDGIGHFVFFGQAPAGTTAIDLVTGGGTTHATVTSPDGYFVVIAELPVPASDRRDVPPPQIQFQRVDAYAADGTLLGTGWLS